MKSMLTVVLVVSVVVVAWKIVQKQPADEPVVQAKDETYTNLTYGYSFNYPTNWEVPLEDGIVGQSSHVSVYNLRTTQALYNEGINNVDDRGKKDIVWTMAPIVINTNKMFSEETSLENIIKNDCLDGQLCDLNTVEDISFAGIAAKKYMRFSPYDVQEIAFIRWPYSYRIVLRKDQQTLKLFDTLDVEKAYSLLVATFRFD